MAREFLHSLSDTVGWFHYAHATESLRSDVFVAGANRPTCEFEVYPEVVNLDSVTALVQMRRSHMSRLGTSRVGTWADLHGGRLLAFAPDESLSDGAAEVASNGYFDDCNIPPWDTWLYFVVDDWKVKQFRRTRQLYGTPLWDPPRFLRYLISWVPPAHIERCDAGITANPEECIMWLNGIEDEATLQLRRLGLLSSHT